MNNLTNTILITILFLSKVLSVNGQEIKNKQTFEQASSNKAKLELVVSKNMADVISKNHETYYKDFLAISKESNAQGEVLVTISANTAEYQRIIKRLLMVSEIKEIVFADKKASLDEFFGF